MAEQKVRVRYIDSALVAQNGCQIFPMGLRLALDYKKKEWIEILDEYEIPPNLMPKPPQQKTEPQIDDSHLTEISWVTNEFIDTTTRKIGEKVGFKVVPFPAPMLSSGLTMKVKLLLVESALKGFTTNQLINLRWLQFQRSIPFIFRIMANSNTDEFKQSLIHSKLNIFASQKIFDYVIEAHEGLLMGDWYVEDKDDYYGFWRKIDEVVKAIPPKPQPKKKVEKLLVIKDEAKSIPKEVFDSTEHLQDILTGEGKLGVFDPKDIESIPKILPSAPELILPEGCGKFEPGDLKKLAEDPNPPFKASIKKRSLKRKS